MIIRGRGSGGPEGDARRFSRNLRFLGGEIDGLCYRVLVFVGF